MWWIIQPLLDLSIYYLLFAVIMKRGGDGYVAFLFIGLVTWKWLVQIILTSCSSLVGNKSLILSFPTPKYVYPLIDCFMQSAKFIPAFLLCLVGYAFFYGLSFNHIYLVPILLSQFSLCVACALFCSAIVPFFLDLQLIFPVLIRLAFYPSGILFDPSTLSPELQKYIYLNPLVGLFESYRSVMLYNKTPDLLPLLFVFLLSLLIGSVGSYILHVNNKKYAKMRF